MTRPRIIRYIAPPTTAPRGSAGDSGAMTVDYADVLHQAVANERFRILREIRTAVEKVMLTEHEDTYAYRSKDRTADSFKEDVLRILTRLEEEA